MIIFRPFIKKDAQLETIEAVDKWPDEFAEAVEKSQLAVTGVWNNQVIGCGGIHPVNSEQGELWLRLSKWCVSHPVETMRQMVEAFLIVEKTCPFKQLNAVIKEGFCTERIVKRLGFSEVCKKSGFTVYAKVIK